MTKACSQCRASFEITDEDLGFYEKVSPVFNEKKYQVPPPTLCPDCRIQLQFSFRNERTFYSRSCDRCKKTIIALYSPDKQYTVYCPECWWSDENNPLQYGQAYDGNRPFFEQLQELHRNVPRLAIQYAKSQNCDYTNYSAENKDCYLSVGMLGDENCYYCYRVFYSKDSFDSYDLYKCELCYECLESSQLYHCSFCIRCQNSNDLSLCYNCSGCKNCFGCVNLQHAGYYIFNKAYSKDQYFQEVEKLKNDWKTAKEKFRELCLQHAHKAVSILNSVHSTGDLLTNCKNCKDCFITKNSEDCQRLYAADHNKDCYDSIFVDNCELQYNSMSLEKDYNVISSNFAWYVHDSYYVTLCFNSSNLFACFGLKKNEYCILNKQYTKEEYEQLVPRIIEKMKADGEWGQFFPSSLSPFGYNETIANEYYPLSKGPALKKGFNWSDYEAPAPVVAKVVTQEQMKKLPDNIKDIPDDILNWALTCEVSNKPYKIIKQELKFYREHNLPIPHRHPDQRHKDRMALRNPRKLYDRTCMKCNKAIQTTYAPDRPEIIYCEECYLREVY